VRESERHFGEVFRLLGVLLTPQDSYGESFYNPFLDDVVAELESNTELLRRAGAALGEGESVVLDASWADRRFREEAARAAGAVAAELVELRCLVPPEVAAARLGSRPPTDPSDATPELARRMAEDADPWPSATPIDTSGSPEAALAVTLGVAVGNSEAPPSPVDS
jgi:hypothetical protein